MATKNICIATCLAAALILTGACRGKHHRTSVENEEPAEATTPETTPTHLTSSLKVNDPGASTQLVKGFYGIEGGSWRWTAGHFSIVLSSPLSSAQRGGTLTLAFNVPDIVIRKLGSITLSAAVGVTKLKSETYNKPGSYTFTADIAPELLSNDTITVDFALDKSLTPGSVDQRELGIIVTAVGVVSK